MFKSVTLRDFVLWLTYTGFAGIIYYDIRRWIDLILKGWAMIENGVAQ